MQKVQQIKHLLATMLDNNTLLNFTNEEISRYFQIVNTTNDANDDGGIFGGCVENCEGLLQDAAVRYGKYYHIYSSMIVCIFGTISNLLNIAVLTRKDMACAPINRILTGLAVADILIMLEYIPFAYYYYVELPGKLNFPYWAAVYMLFHTHFTQTLHTISICLTLTLAIWRYLAIGHPERIQTLCSEGRCKLGIILSYTLPLLLCCPVYLSFKIQSTIIVEDKEYVLYFIDLSEMAKKNDYLVINFWLYAVIIKLLPCVILTIISCWLIRTLFITKKRKQILRDYNLCPMGEGNRGSTKAERRATRTTKMLVAVLCLFLLTEFPQGIFGLVIGMKGKCIFLKCYQNFGEVIDILALLNGSINFILYCWMNRMFRMTFGQLFRSKIMAKWAAPTNSDLCTTYV